MVFALQQDDWATASVASGDYATDWHTHDCAMLLLPRQGRMLCGLEGVRRPSVIRPGEALLVAPGVGHRTRAADATHRHIVLYARPARLAAWLPLRRGWHLGALPPHMLPLLAYRDAVPDGSARAGLAERLLIEEACGSAPAPMPAQHGAALAQAVAEHLRAQLHQAHTLDDLAARFGISRRQLTRLFRRHIGASIADHLGALRAREAARRIAAGQGVLAAAHAVGLASPSHLARLCRRHLGHAPAASRSGAR